MVTIKELSDSIGISKVGITKWIERNGYKDRLQKIGNKYYIPAEVEQVVRANFDRRETKPKKVANDTRETENTVTSEIIALLREQLETKDREIERLHTQIENLQKINADTVKALRESNTLQALQLTDGLDKMDYAEDLQRSKSEARENDDSSEEVVRDQNQGEVRANKSFISRIFRIFR